MNRTQLRTGIVVVAIAAAVALGLLFVPQIRLAPTNADRKPEGATVTLDAPAPRPTPALLAEPAALPVAPAPRPTKLVTAAPRRALRPHAAAPVDRPDDVSVTTINSW